MPLKFTKDVSAHLIKYVKSVDISFNPFDARTTSARELLRQIQSTRYQTSNPKLVVNATTTASAAPPSVVFKYVDGTEQAFDSQEFICKEMMDSVFLRAMQIDIDFELDGKSVDDV
mmetsp:Transcript_15982/g.27067  ORF Transcript_15982/g.27067 Transcript_15982/m.27067 type:complete len:116 (+) Transcript_15982:1293-1640(+)